MDSRNRVIKADHEFLAPKLFNYSKGETEELTNKALLEGALTPSNSTSITTEIESLHDLSEAENSQKEAASKSTGFIDTIKNLNMEPEKQRETGLTCKSVRPPKKQKLEEEKTRQNHQWKTNLKIPKLPRLQTSLRARDIKIRNSEELEREQPEKAQKFKARPLNKKILESKGELGLLCNKKRQVTIPKEFHFAIDERIPPRRTVNGAELFNKITLCLKSHNKKLIPRNTIPRPFHLQTEKRGAQKESKFVVEIVHKQIEEGRARIPIPVPKRVRRPLNKVQEFNPHAKMMEEENALKQLRKTLMPSFKQPFLPEKSSNGVTKSKSSRLSGLVMKERRRKLVVAKTSNATSNTSL